MSAYDGGDGQFALLAWCGELSVRLYAKREDAEEQKKIIDKLGCGGSCHKRHEIVDMGSG